MKTPPTPLATRPSVTPLTCLLASLLAAVFTVAPAALALPTPVQPITSFFDIPSTTFSCEQQAGPGIYADTDTECQVFHFCQDGGRSDSFFCPNLTLFNQQYFVCDWAYNVDCNSAPQYYSLNSALYSSPERISKALNPAIRISHQEELLVGAASSEVGRTYNSVITQKKRPLVGETERRGRLLESLNSKSSVSGEPLLSQINQIDSNSIENKENDTKAIESGVEEAPVTISITAASTVEDTPAHKTASSPSLQDDESLPNDNILKTENSLSENVKNSENSLPANELNSENPAALLDPLPRSGKVFIPTTTTPLPLSPYDDTADPEPTPTTYDDYVSDPEPTALPDSYGTSSGAYDAADPEPAAGGSNVYSDIGSSYSQPRYTQADPTYPQSSLGYSQPSSSYSQLDSSYSQASSRSGYSQPSSSYSQPSISSSQLTSSYTQPSPSYAQPSPSYSQPGSSYPLPSNADPGYDSADPEPAAYYGYYDSADPEPAAYYGSSTIDLSSSSSSTYDDDTFADPEPDASSGYYYSDPSAIGPDTADPEPVADPEYSAFSRRR